MRRDGQDGQGGALQATLQFEGKAERRDLARAISIHLLVRALRIIAVVEIETAAHPVREAASADHAGLRRRAQRVEQQAGQCKRAEMIGADMQFETIARPAARYHDRRSAVTEDVETLMLIGKAPCGERVGCYV